MVEPRPLPMCLASEDAVVTAVLIQRTPASEVEDVLDPGLYLDPQNRVIVRAIVALQQAGLPIDIPAVKDWISSNGLSSSLDPAAVQAKLDMTPFVGDVRAHADHILEVAQVRQTILTAQRIAAEGFGVNGNAAEYLDTSVDLLTAATKNTRAAKGFKILSASDILAKREPIKWVCRDLCIGPGRPTLVPGYGYSLKTYSMQSLEVSVASGQKIWGEFRCARSKVLHLDYEQGKDPTCTRFQRIAYGMGLSLDDLDGWLQTCCFPDAYLTTPNVERSLAMLCADIQLCVIDSFKAATPGVLEKDSEVRIYLDMLTRISERTGCAFIVIAHAGKSNPDRDKREAARGSSAIFDACGTVLMMSGSKPFEPVKAELTKTSASASGKIAQCEFYLAATDIADDEGKDDKAGIRIDYQPVDSIEEPQAPAARVNHLREAIVEILSQHPQGLSTREVIAFMRKAGGKGRSQDVSTALMTGAVDGWCRQACRNGRGAGKLWTIVTLSDSTENE